jgi:DNA replication initiation complex subunit (GINS family)
MNNVHKMDDNEINYKILRKIQKNEEENSILTKIDESIYNKIYFYLEKLNQRYKTEKNKQKKIIIKNEIDNTSKIIKTIYEMREKKILFAIMTKVRGGKPNLSNLVNSEKKLFDSILELLIQSRQNYIEKKISYNEKNNRKNIIKEKSENKINKENTKIIMVKENIPEFIGMDGNRYNLRKGDIITISKNTCDLLLKRKVVKEIKYNNI